MASLYIGVYRALYDYDARDELELSIKANDLLYLLEKSDIDDWWTVKKHVPLESGLETEEPSGIVPSNYIEAAPVLHTCHALYDYDKQTQEEISFKEGTVFNVYDVSDPDWLLVGLSDDSQFGYVPSNYVEKDAATVAAAAAPSAIGSSQVSRVGAAVQPTVMPLSAFAAPPQHKSRVTEQKETPENPNRSPGKGPEQAIDVEGDSIDKRQLELALQTQRNINVDDEEEVEEEEEAPPPMPTRPNEVGPSSRISSQQSPQKEAQTHSVDEGFFRWFISELHRDKKTPVELAVSSSEIIFKRDLDTKLKSGEELQYRWPIGRLTNYNHEKKHLFLDFEGPTKSLHLYTNDKHVSEAIVSILGEYKGAHEAKGLVEIARAVSIKTSKSNKMVGRVLYRFKAEGQNEMLADAGEKVYVLQGNKSKDWWLCERMNKKKQGYIPASYIEIVGTQAMEEMVGSRTKESPMKLFFHLRGRLDRDKIRENDRVKRNKQKHSDADNMPNFHRVRTWIDSSGTFKVEAELLGYKDGKIHLHKTNGVKIAVAAAKLSVEDLEYVEKVNEVSLEEYKEEVIRAAARRAKKSKEQNAQYSKNEDSSLAPSVPQKDAVEKPGIANSKSATALINEVTPSRTKAETALQSTNNIPQSEPDYDWFEFFLNCGVDIGNCQRYSVTFSKEQMDESILEDITPTLLRSLGLREGDILRVTKHLNGKFDNKKTESTGASTPSGSLFTEPSGELKNNSAVESTKVNASALPTPAAKPTESIKIEDDAWAVKPAARSTEDLSKPDSKPQYTGSLHDLIDIKPLEANKAASTPQKPAPATPNTPSLAALEPTKTASAPVNTNAANPTGQHAFMVMKTGGLVPVSGTGLIPVQPTGFMPIGAQPTGFVPIQATGIVGTATGGFGMQPTGGFSVIPLQTGATTFIPQKTGPPIPSVPPPTTFIQAFQPTGGFAPVQTGNISTAPLLFQNTQTALQPVNTFNQPAIATGSQLMPSTTFGQGFVGTQATGGLRMASQVTGQALSNVFVPQSTFGKQITGGLMNANRTGGLANPVGVQSGPFGQMPPQTSFSAQATGGMPYQTTFTSQVTGGMPPLSTFGNGQATGGMLPISTFGNGQALQIGMDQMTNMFQNTTMTGYQNQPSQNQSGQPQLGQPQFGQPQFGQPQAGQFGQPQAGQFGQPQFGQPWQQNTFSQPPFQATAFNQMPINATSFGDQPKFDGFQNTPLQAQPTGLGFGNAPGLQSQPTGKRANLESATADNPFGF